MKPAAFRYAAPGSMNDALHLLRESGEEARVLAGGQSLVPMMNFRLVQPSVLIDLNRMPGWSFIDIRDGALVIGAMTRQAMIEDSPVVASHCALLADAVRLVAHRQIRTRGTLGGSLALAYPGAELPLVVLTLGGEITVVSLDGERCIPAVKFFRGALSTSLRPDELITSVRLPLCAANAGMAFVEVSRRHGDFALVGAAVVLELDGASNIRLARIGVTGVTAMPVRAASAEAVLLGKPAVEESFVAAAGIAAAEVDVLDDPQYPALYRRELVAAIVRRGLRLAASRVGGVDGA